MSRANNPGLVATGKEPPYDYACIKCGKSSGDDWSQCGGACPVEDSPHYKTPIEMKLMAYPKKYSRLAILLEVVEEEVGEQVFLSPISMLGRCPPIITWGVEGVSGLRYGYAEGTKEDALLNVLEQKETE